MAWARFQSGKSLYRLTDGYIEEATTAQLDSKATTFEEQMATNIFRLADRPYRSNEVSGIGRTDPLGVWVLGKPRWLESEVAEPVRSILESEVDPSYRIVITCEGPTETCIAPGADWSGWIYMNGMRKKKRHTSVATFKSAADTLLSLMHDYDADPETTAAQLLSAFEIPFAYTGRSGANFDGTPSSRTQQ